MERDEGTSSRLAALFKPGAPPKLYEFNNSVHKHRKPRYVASVLTHGPASS